VLFQDYTHFPLSVSQHCPPSWSCLISIKIKDNIGLGDPENARDEDRIVEAARLGGAQEFIERLPDGFDTYLERPVRDYYSGLPDGTKTLFGRPIDGSIHPLLGSHTRGRGGLSGGELQRLAV
jgi:ABC-type multidrug transport system fused ATPase/permease subunit